VFQSDEEAKLGKTYGVAGCGWGWLGSGVVGGLAGLVQGGSSRRHILDPDGGETEAVGEIRWKLGSSRVGGSGGGVTVGNWPYTWQLAAG